MTISEITRDFLRGMPLPSPEGGDKKARGTVLVIGGSVEVPGAALLAGVAALRAGAGRIQIATCARNATSLGVAMPEALVMGLAETAGGGIEPKAAKLLIEKLDLCEAVLVGPGMDDPAATQALTADMLAQAPIGPGFVIDAIAIQGLLDHRDAMRRHKGRAVLTPHAGEMAGLLGISRDEVEAEPEAAARRAATDLHCVVALKGATTFIVDPDGECTLSKAGNSGLGTAGSGDTLAGVIAGLLARGTPPFAATCWGVFMHATAGERLANRIGPLGYLASEVPGEIPGIMASISGSPAV